MKTRAALVLTAFLSATGLAAADDFTRGSGGEISMLTKQRQLLSGSVFAATSGSLSFGSGGLTLGGPI
ncbi:MAG TPA: hypothetical protein VNL91_02810, partial [Thermoanaerobaculia bacterium]|nr:hypothetical protein [Thermoanaerobaculia bacterium]